MAKPLLTMATRGQLCIKIYTPCRDHPFEGRRLSCAEENHKNLLRIIGIPAEIKSRQLSNSSQKHHRYANLLSDSPQFIRTCNDRSRANLHPVFIHNGEEAPFVTLSGRPAAV